MKIYGHGNPNAEVAFVGDCALAQDLKTGMPFSGRDGENLKDRLSLLGKSQSSYYWTYFIKDRLSCTSVVTYNKVKRHSEVETKDTFSAYEEELIQEMHNLPNLKVIFAVGETAMFALTRQTEITKRRGSIYTCVFDSTIRVVPLIHPREWMISFYNDEKKFGNYVYAQYTYYDMKKVFDVLDTGEQIETPEYNLILKPTFQQAVDYLQSCMLENTIAFDIETDSELQVVSCISFAKKDGSSISIPFKDNYKNYFMLNQEIEIWKTIAKLLGNPGVTKVGQFITFDITYLWRVYCIETVNVEDTLTGFKLLFPDFSASLATICSVCTNQPYYKDTGKEHIKYNTTDLSFWEYNALDSVVTLESWYKIKQALQQRELWVTYTKQRDLIYPLLYMGEYGIQVDVERINEYSTYLHDRADEFQKKLDEKYVEVYTKKYGKAPGKPTLNVNSSKDMSEYFYVVKGEHPYKNKNGGIACDKDAMKRLIRKGHIEATWVTEIRACKKMASTYVDIKLEPDNRLRSSYNPGGTVTGRLSSSGTFFGTGTNAQNLPPEYKKYLIADPNTLLYDLDLSGADNRVVAYIAPDPNMIHAFEEGIDLHSLTGSLISGLTIEEVKRQHKAGIPCKIADGTKTWRDWGKRTNHSLNYGMGYRTFALRYEMPENEAKHIIQKYYEAYPGVTKFQNWVKAAIRYDRTLVNCLGRKRTYFGYLDNKLFNEAFSFIPQSTVADIINQRGLLFIWKNKDQFPGLKLLQQVHDSVVLSISLDLPLSTHVNYLKLIKASLETTIAWRSLSFKIPLECKVGRALNPMEKVNLNLPDEEIKAILSKI